MKIAYLAGAALCAAMIGSAHAGIVTVRDAVGGEDPYDPGNGYYLGGTSSIVNATYNGTDWVSAAVGTFDLEISLAFEEGVSSTSSFESFLTYCIEPQEDVGFGLNLPDDTGMLYEVTSLEAAGYSASEAQMIRILWANAFALSQTDIILAGAFQAILWELQLDDSIDLEAGNFQLNWEQAHSLAVITKAQEWISNINLGVWTEKANLLALQAPGSQNFILPVDVPEPGAMALLGIGLFTAYTRRRRRTMA